MNKDQLIALQKEYLPAIQWLISEGHRLEGRSTLLAYAFILEAIKHKSRPIRMFDHGSPMSHSISGSELIASICKSLIDTTFPDTKWEITRNYIQYLGKKIMPYRMKTHILSAKPYTYVRTTIKNVPLYKSLCGIKEPKSQAYGNLQSTCKKCIKLQSIKTKKSSE